MRFTKRQRLTRPGKTSCEASRQPWETYPRAPLSHGGAIDSTLCRGQTSSEKGRRNTGTSPRVPQGHTIESIGVGLVEYWLEMAAAEEAVTDDPAIASRSSSRRAREDQ